MQIGAHSVKLQRINEGMQQPTSTSDQMLKNLNLAKQSISLEMNKQIGSYQVSRDVHANKGSKTHNLVEAGAVAPVVP